MKKRNLIMLSILTVILLIIVSCFACYNSLVTSEERVDAQYSVVESKLQRRYDLIPNLVNAVKGYMEHEQSLFTEIADARSKLSGADSTDDRVAANNELESSLSRLLMLVENYPELKSDTQIIALMDELSGTENRISVERDRYNEEVRQYNSRLRRFPSNLIANAFNFEPRAYFEASDGADIVPEVDFN